MIAANGPTSRSGTAAERQADLETILRHHQIPELMLQNDRHLFRILRQKPRRQLYAIGGGQEGDEEMMLAGQAVFGSVGQHAAQHPAQRVTRQHVITDMIGRHARLLR